MPSPEPDVCADPALWAIRSLSPLAPLSLPTMRQDPATSSGPPDRKRGISGARKREIPRLRLGVTTTKRDELLALRNIGPAMRRDFALLGVQTVRQLARCNPERLYARLQALTGQRQDPCVLDTFAAAIHQVRTGEALPWWHFSRVRKRRHLPARRS